MDERALVQAAQTGDRTAFEELVRATYPGTYTLALRLTSNEEDASDVAQEAYLRAWRGIGSFRGDAQFSTWLYRITANAAATHLQRRRRRATEPLEAHAEPADPTPGGQPASAVEAAELAERLAEAVDALPAKLRQVVVLRDVYALPHEAIAQELGITEAAAKVRLHRARRKLKESLFDAGEHAHAV